MQPTQPTQPPEPAAAQPGVGEPGPAEPGLARPPGPPRPPGGATALRWITRVQAALVFLQAAFAGQFLDGNDVALSLHQGNAELIFWVAIAQLVIAITVWRRRGPGWPAAASLLLLLAITFQLGLGYSRQIAFHVPLGVAIFGTTVWLLLGTRRLAPGRRAGRRPR